MRKFKFFFLSVLMVVASLGFTACGMGNNMNSGTEAPYEDDVKDTTNNGVNDGNMGDNIKDGVDNIGDDIKNGVDNVEEGIDNGIDGIRDGNRTSRLEEANQNLRDSIQEARKAIQEGLVKLSNIRR